VTILPDIRILKKKPLTLVAEDRESMARVIVAMISQRCDVISVANNGEKALQAVLEARPQLLILDIVMRELDGIQVIRRLRSLEIASRIIILTGLEDQDFVQASMTAGADAYVIKRRMSPDLLKAIDLVLDGKNFVSELNPGRTRNLC